MEKSVSIKFKKNVLLPVIYGSKNENLRFIEKALAVSISSRGNYLAITGESDGVEVASALLESLYSIAEKGVAGISTQDIKAIVEKIHTNTNTESSKNVSQSQLILKTKRKNVYAYNDAQFLSLIHI